MKTKKPVVAICYDFDGTLSPGNMQEYGFFPGLSKEDRRNFWKQSAKLAKDNRANHILTYMQLMLEKAEASKNNTNVPLKTTRKAIREYGKDIQLFPGVDTWFKRIGEYGKGLKLQVEHYIVSSGLTEMIEGSPIGKEFKGIYACSFMYDNNDVAKWPAQVVDCTSKTQYLFRISKAADDLSDTRKLNTPVKEEDRHVPFSRMIYIGDGSTDVPSMTLVQSRGGHSIAVYQPKSSTKRQEALKLLEDERVNFCFPADYSEGGKLEEAIKRILDFISASWQLEKMKSGIAKTQPRNTGGNSSQVSPVEESPAPPATPSGT